MAEPNINVIIVTFSTELPDSFHVYLSHCEAPNHSVLKELLNLWAGFHSLTLPSSYPDC